MSKVSADSWERPPRPDGGAPESAVLAWLHCEYSRPFTGWDFSYLRGRRVELETPKPWSYENVAKSGALDAQSILDVDTGGGEVYAEIVADVGGHHSWMASEAYLPNLAVARDRLSPLGVGTVAGRGDALPFRNQSFDLLLNRHGYLAAPEVARVLRRNGELITQGVGAGTNRELHEVLGAPVGAPYAQLDRERAALEGAGLRVEQATAHSHPTEFHDAGAVAYYLKAIPWEVPDFSVDRYAEPLVRLHRRLSEGPPLVVRFNLIFLRARNTA